ncbi:hypothetical protein LEN26_010012 [Aphanomyces euteiches]|nr:hypothetical protein AeMF1_020096 [Aphanomyces euteiches]KAH9123147.1 hypothetical protein LEN26_010012 [Aphanomyces euteiches]KAH9193560.1 hypothetical protein AeNC1_004459 [Aphanomyces euteiches]
MEEAVDDTWDDLAILKAFDAALNKHRAPAASVADNKAKKKAQPARPSPAPHTQFKQTAPSQSPSSSTPHEATTSYTQYQQPTPSNKPTQSYPPSYPPHETSIPQAQYQQPTPRYQPMPSYPPSYPPHEMPIPHTHYQSPSTFVPPPSPSPYNPPVYHPHMFEMHRPMYPPEHFPQNLHGAPPSMSSYADAYARAYAQAMTHGVHNSGSPAPPYPFGFNNSVPPGGPSGLPNVPGLSITPMEGDDDLTKLLLSWYQSGYYAGRFKASQEMKRMAYYR